MLKDQVRSSDTPKKMYFFFSFFFSFLFFDEFNENLMAIE